MARILQLRRTSEPANSDVMQFTLLRKVFDAIQKRQNEIYNKKLKFLLNEAYQWFLDESDEVIIGTLEIPYFIYEQQRRKAAYNNAVEALRDVVREKRVDVCYKKRINQYKNEVKGL